MWEIQQFEVCTYEELIHKNTYALCGNSGVAWAQVCMFG